MTESGRKFSAIDSLIGEFDDVLKRRLKAARGTTADERWNPARPSPADEVMDGALSEAEKRHSAGLMRVNHSGEVCAQALYTGQAAVAADATLTAELQAAGTEERDHLRWCEQRLAELGARPSALNPGWWFGSLVIGVIAGACGDRLSLGFIEETERQVCEHLEGHLEALPAADRKSRAIVEAMRADEAAHAAKAHARGARELPAAVKKLMKLQARVMTRTAYWI